MKITILDPVYPISEITNNFSKPLEVIEVGEKAESSTEEFIIVLWELLRSDHSQNTKKAILSDMKLFYSWYCEYNRENFSFLRCLRDDIISYKTHLIDTKKASRSVNRKLSHLRIFFRKAEEMEYIKKDPTIWVRKLPSPQLIPRAISQAEYRRIIKEVSIRDDIRAKCIFELMGLAGLRVSEVASLELSDIRLSERKGTLLVRHSKGNKTRQIPMIQELRETMKTYMEKHQDELGAFLFSWYGERLQEISIHKICEKYGTLTNVSCTCHQFRHYFWTSFLQKNPWDVVALAQLMGHSSLQSTFCYTQNTEESLEDKMSA